MLVFHDIVTDNFCKTKTGMQPVLATKKCDSVIEV